VLIWVGVAVALVGSLLILYLSYRQMEEDLHALVEVAAHRHGLDPRLVAAVVEAESKGRPRAVSRAQAYGLMQLRVPTASEVAGRKVGVEELFDPVVNLDLGCKYLRRLIDIYAGDVRLALMAYNAGPGNLEKWMRRESNPERILENLAFGETRYYVRKVLRLARAEP
jgi:soluble lytic murein transglycosylase